MSRANLISKLGTLVVSELNGMKFSSGNVVKMGVSLGVGFVAGEAYYLYKYLDFRLQERRADKALNVLSESIKVFKRDIVIDSNQDLHKIQDDRNTLRIEILTEKIAELVNKTQRENHKSEMERIRTKGMLITAGVTATTFTVLSVFEKPLQSFISRQFM